VPKRGQQEEINFNEEPEEKKPKNKSSKEKPSKKAVKSEKEETPKEEGQEPVQGEAKGPRVIPATIEEEMKSSYIDYAMSVIVGRALPDVRDGLKPVHRRILFAMDDLGLHPNKSHKKCARVVGEVLGKYHPHGDMSVYDALVRMAQNFSLRYPLVNGQGNFGSVDGDNAAAMRYTEAKLMLMATELLADLDKETVNYGPNFDETLQEPLVLPSKIPNLLINGSSGIAVGMATNIPPQNLGEVIDGLINVIEDPDVTIEQLMKHVKAPDFPTGGIICGMQGVKDAYLTGRGLIKVRAKVFREDVKSGKEAIIVTELPYQVNKSQLVERIADMVKDKKLTGISDLRDESDRTGMRIYIELKRDTNADIVINQLYKHTDMQTTFGVNLLALVNGQPKLLTLKDMMIEYIKHRQEVIERRTKYDLRKAEEQAHILEGLLIALANIDPIIKLIKSSKTVDEARSGLAKKFDLTVIQAQAILDMRLQRLTGLEREKIEEEYKSIKKLISELKDILSSMKNILSVVKKELLEIKEKYNDKRKTQITGAAEEFNLENLIEEMEVAIPITRDGFIKRMQITSFRSQLRGGHGVTGMATREEDLIDQIAVASTHDFILFFTSLGRVYRLKAYEIPESSRVSKGTSIANLLEFAEGEKVTAVISVKNFEEKNQFLVMATKNGVIKKTSLEEFENIRRSGIIAIGLKDNDELRWVRMTNGTKELILGTKFGKAIRFKEKDVRPMGRSASGVKGIGLGPKDQVISMDVIAEGLQFLIVTRSGYGKRCEIKGFRMQHRGGKGIKSANLRKGDELATLMLINPTDEILVITSSGILSRQKVSGISVQSRYARGVIVQRLGNKDSIVDIALVHQEENIEIIK